MSIVPILRKILLDQIKPCYYLPRKGKTTVTQDRKMDPMKDVRRSITMQRRVWDALERVARESKRTPSMQLEAILMVYLNVGNITDETLPDIKRPMARPFAGGQVAGDYVRPNERHPLKLGATTPWEEAASEATQQAQLKKPSRRRKQ